VWLDQAIPFAAIGMEAAVFILLMRGRAFRGLPIFCLYLLWTWASDIAGLIVVRLYQAHYFQFYQLEMLIDALLQLGVLIELAWSILGPVRKSLPRFTIVYLTILMLLMSCLVWPFSASTGFEQLGPQWHSLLRVHQTISILRVLAFLIISGGSHVLALGWRSRELQIATGLGFYSLISLGASMLHSHQSTAASYHIVEQLVAASYLCSLVYWAVSFAQQEAPRQEFSPKMQSFLLAMGGAARASRISMLDGRGGQRENTKP